MREDKKLVYGSYFLNGQKNEYIIVRLYESGEITCDRRPVDAQGLRLEYIKQELRLSHVQAQEDYELAPLLVKIANHLHKLGDAFERRSMLRPQLGFALSQLCPTLSLFESKMFTVDTDNDTQIITKVIVHKNGSISSSKAMFTNEDKAADHILELREEGYQFDILGDITQATKRLGNYNQMMQNTLAETQHNLCDMPTSESYQFKRF